MTADERLDQLEPLLSEALTVLDRHTYQLKQLNGAVGNLAINMAKQGDDITFLLQEQSIIKTDIAGMRTDIADMRTDIADMKTDIAGTKTDIAGINGKLDLLIQLIQDSGK